jgi:hypothetical protein
MPSSEMSRRVTLVRTDASEKLIASIIRMTRNVEQGERLAVTSNRSTLPHGVTSEKTAFFGVKIFLKFVFVFYYIL